jgi:hypothetical protein
MVTASSPRMRHAGSSSPAGFQPASATIGSEVRLATSSTTCSVTCLRVASLRVVQSE